MPQHLRNMYTYHGRFNRRSWRFADCIGLAFIPFLSWTGSIAQTAPAAGAVAGSTMQPPIAGAGHDYVHLLSESVNPATGNLTIRIQLPAPPGRGISPPSVIAYNSGEVSSLAEPSGQLLWATSPQNTSGGGTGWGAPSSLPLTGSATQWNFTSPTIPQGYTAPINCNYASGFSFTDLNGTAHTLSVGAVASVENNNNGGSCPNSSVVSTGESDGQTQSVLPSNTAQLLANGTGIPVSVIDIYGNTYLVGTPGMGQPCCQPVSMEDRNGNLVTFTSGYPPTTDTAGRAMFLQLPDAAGSYSMYGMTYTITTKAATTDYTPAQALTIESGASNCNTTGVLPANSASLTVISSIQLPNGQTYQFQYDPTFGVIDQVTYPNGGWVKYTWQLSPTYSSVASFPAAQESTGMPMPDACTVQYQTPVVATRSVSFDGTHIAQSQTFSYSTTWNGGVWTSKNTQIWTTDVNAGNKTFLTNYTFTPTANDVASPFSSASYSILPMEQTVQHYDWGNPQPSTPLDTVTEAWYNQFQKACEVHTLDSNQSYGHFYQYSYGFVSDDKAYDFGQVSNLANYCTSTNPAPPSLTPARETVTTFAPFASPISPHMTFARPASVTVYGNGAELAQTQYGYDNPNSTLVQVTDLTSHDEANFPSTVTQGRGNLTSITRVCISGTGCTGNSITTYTYDETGQVESMTDSCGSASCPDMSGSSHTTTYSHLDNYAGGGSGQTDAYLTGITYPATNTSHTESFEYNWQSGELVSSTDENDLTTNYTYNDPLDRLTETQGPSDPNNGGQRPTTTITYNDSAATVTTSELLNTSSVWKTSVQILDGLGHTTQTQLTTDPDGTDFVDMAYDGEGRILSKSNPHRSPPAPTDGKTYFYYDAMGRTVVQIQPDGSDLVSCYNGVVSTLPSGVSSNCASHLGSLTTGSWVDATDETGRHWQRTSDSFGRLTEVMEPNSSNTPGLETDYGYDGLNNLLAVTQKGTGTGTVSRSFAYDSLGHLISARNPETASLQNPASLTCSASGGPWTTCYAFDANGNLSATKNNRGITTNYGYDNLNRLVSKTYSGDNTATPNTCFEYDVSSISGSGGNLVGRLTNEWTQSVSAGGCAAAPPSSGYLTLRAILAYDSMGRTTSEAHWTPSTSGGSPYTLDYGYDLAGNLTYSTNGISATPGSSTPLSFSSSYDGAAQLQTLTSSWSNTQHPLPSTLFSSSTPSSSACGQAASYAPFGGLLNASLGNGLAVSRGYDNRLRPSCETGTGSLVINATPGTAAISITGTEQTQ